jgi:hypothetical protein
LDRPLQVRGGLSSIHRRAPPFPRLLGLHQRCTTLIKRPPRPDGASILVGRAQALEVHESSKLPGSAHLSAAPTWLGGPGHWKGMSPPNYPAQPTFLCLQLGRAGPGIGRAQVLQATRLSHLSAFLTRLGGPGHWKGMSPPRYLAQPTSLHFQLGRAGSGIRWAQSLPSYLTPAHFFAPQTPTTCRA